jgi:hypothetical protein
MNRLLMIVITFAIILILYLGPGSAKKDPKPATQHASQPTVTTGDFADGLQGTLDQKYKLGLQFRFEAQLSSLRVALSNPLDQNGATSALNDQDQLVKDVKDARASLIAGGTPPATVDAWLQSTSWPACKKLAEQLRKQQSEANPPEDNATPDGK